MQNPREYLNVEMAAAPASRDDDRLALETLRAAQRTAQAVEEIARHGVRLRDPPPAVWAE